MSSASEGDRLDQVEAMVRTILALPNCQQKEVERHIAGILLE